MVSSWIFRLFGITTAASILAGCQTTAERIQEIKDKKIATCANVFAIKREYCEQYSDLRYIAGNYDF